MTRVLYLDGEGVVLSAAAAGDGELSSDSPIIDGEWDIQGDVAAETLTGTAADPTEVPSTVPARTFNIKPFIIIGIVLGVVLAVILAVVKANKKFGKGFD